MSSALRLISDAKARSRADFPSGSEVTADMETVSRSSQRDTTRKVRLSHACLLLLSVLKGVDGDEAPGRQLST